MGNSKETQINISHNFSGREFTKKSLEKYFVFSQAIELFVFQKEIGALSDCSLTTIEENIKKCSRGKIKDMDWIGRWVAELKFMGLIECVEGDSIRFRLTSAGRESYRQQTFQSIYANLLNAKYSRRLSIIAIVISVLALLISAIWG